MPFFTILSPVRGLPRVHLAPLLVALFVFLSTGGCSSEEVAAERGGEAPGPPPLPLPVLREGPDIPVDIRLPRLLPERYVDTERVCDIEVLGEPAEVSLGARARYPTPVASRATVRCRAATGGGWADLVFSPESAQLAPSVVAERRIRARILSPGGGFDDYPIIEFIAVLGESPPAPPRAGALVAVPSGFDFGSLTSDSPALGAVRGCAISHVGQVDLIPERESERYPRSATHRLTVGCRHAQGDGWIDLLFTRETLLGSLRILRGRIVPVRIESSAGGTDGHAIASYISG